MHLSSIRKTKAVLDSCVYDSLLIISVQDPSQRAPQAFLFQCEEAGVRNSTLFVYSEMLDSSKGRYSGASSCYKSFLIYLVYLCGSFHSTPSVSSLNICIKASLLFQIAIGSGGGK